MTEKHFSFISRNRQRIVLWIAFVLVLSAGLFPPWKKETEMFLQDQNYNEHLFRFENGTCFRFIGEPTEFPFEKSELLYRPLDYFDTFGALIIYTLDPQKWFEIEGTIIMLSGLAFLALRRTKIE